MAHAAPITLDFEGGEDLLLDPETPRPVYLEEDFEIGVEGDLFTIEEQEFFDVEPGVGPALGELLDAVPTAFEPVATAYEICRADGRSFDALSLTIESVYTDTLIEHLEVAEVRTFEDGESSVVQELLGQLYWAFVEIDLTGIRRDGSTVAAGINPLTLGGFDPVQDKPRFAIANPQLGLSGLGLTDIQTLRIEWGEPDVTFEEIVCDPLNLGRVQGLAGRTPDLCAGLDQATRGSARSSPRRSTRRSSATPIRRRPKASSWAPSPCPPGCRSWPGEPAPSPWPWSAAGRDAMEAPRGAPCAQATVMRSATFSQLTSSSRKFLR